ncbi:hypothetical protein CPB86DRAFT_819350 [Serendipita vermifera]|nr:hypothetical protein CPB86DRAFT_819350 [Serendipita vermifera]
MNNPYGEQDDHQPPYYFASTSNASSRAQDGQQTPQQRQPSHQQQQSSALLNTAMDDPDSPLQYSHVDSESSKLAMEMIGITPTTFSSNIQFQIPRFMQDAFDPALLHAPSAPTSSSAFPSSSSPNTQTQSALIASLTNPSYGFNSSGAVPNQAYPSIQYPIPPMFPPIPAPDSAYQPATISTAAGLESTISAMPSHEPQKPPRASSLALNGLPIYSASGFDMLDILARVATRPQPKVALGPVDLTCAFLVVDVTRDDSPIIYASATFSELTGYTEAEILGKNCRFLQAPPGVSLERGGLREHTDIDSVAQMAQSVHANRECQVTLVNYRKNGEPFINCVSIIPIVPGGSEPVRYHVGFQVDLAIQPLAIMRSVQNGSYITNYSSTPLPPFMYQPNKLNIRAISKDMADVLNRTGTIADPSSMNDSQDRHRLSLLLLEECSDAIFVVSLKGSFLYVSPSVTRLLNFHPDYFLNKNLSDICHPSDLAPTMRNLKESSASVAANPPPLNPASSPSQDIELLFRARRSDGSYIWLDCPGKLHADTSRGRKALLLRLRKVEMPRLTWKLINDSGGVHKDDCYLRVARDERGLIVACSKSIEDVLGRKAEEIVGKSLIELVIDDAEGSKRELIKKALGVADVACNQIDETRSSEIVYCNVPAATPNKDKKRKSPMESATDGTNGRSIVLATTEIRFFPPLPMKLGPSPEERQSSPQESATTPWRRTPGTLIVRLRVLQRRMMRSNLPEASVGAQAGPTALYQQAPKVSGASLSIVPPLSSTFPSSTPTSYYSSYGLSTNELSLVPITQPITSPLQLFRSDSSSSNGNNRPPRRKTGYQVPLNGSVNLIEDTTHQEGSSSVSNSAYVDPSQTSESPVTTGGVGVGSSWQYELQQLRMRNEKLRAELAALKKEHRARRRESMLGRLSTDGVHSNMATAAHLGTGQTSAPSGPSTGWPSGYPSGSGSSAAYSAAVKHTGAPSHGIPQYPPSRANLSIPPAPHPLTHTYSSQDGHSSESGNKRTWSQTDMNTEWGHWND